MANQIHWFPGHMNKALHEMEEKIKIIDIVIELLDARAPNSSINPQLEEMIKNKKRIVILTKPDLADDRLTNAWVNRLKEKYNVVLALDLTKQNATNEIAKAVSFLGKDKWAKDKSKGMKPQPLKTMILGIPNVGKSSLINRLAKRNAAGVQNKPGYTRGEQWIKVNNDFLLLDTPGVLPMSYENQKNAANLALIGSIREDILPNEDLVNVLIAYLKEYYPNSLKDRFGIEEIASSEEVVSSICERRKILTTNGEKDIVRGQALLLKEFKDGKLGKITLEQL